MNVLQHTRNERNSCLKQNRPDRSYRDTLNFLLKFVNVGISCFHNSLLPRKLVEKEEGRMNLEKLKKIVFTQTETEN